MNRDQVQPLEEELEIIREVEHRCPAYWATVDLRDSILRKPWASISKPRSWRLKRTRVISLATTAKGWWDALCFGQWLAAMFE